MPGMSIAHTLRGRIGYTVHSWMGRSAYLWRDVRPGEASEDETDISGTGEGVSLAESTANKDTKMHKRTNGLCVLGDFVTSWLRPVWLRLFLVGGSQGTRWCLVASAAACARLAAPSFWRQALTWCRAVAVLITRLLGDLFVAQALNDQRQHLAFACAQVVSPAGGASSWCGSARWSPPGTAPTARHGPSEWRRPAC